MLRFGIWLLSACVLATPGVLVSRAEPGAAPPPAGAAAPALAQLFPEGELASVHVPSGLALWTSPVLTTVREAAVEAGALAELQELRATLQLATGVDPADTLRFVFGGELRAALYEGRVSRLAEASARRPREFLLVARAGEAEGLARAVAALLALVGRDHEVDRRSYRDCEYARIDRRQLVAAAGELLLVASDEELFAGALDRWIDGAGAAAAPTASPAPPGGSPGDLLGFRCDFGRLQPSELKLVQQSGRRLLGRRVANPLANLLFGGLTFGDGQVEGRLTGAAGTWLLQARMPLPPAEAPAAWIPPGPDVQGVPVTSETLAVLHARRDVADWWRRRETLMSEDSQPALARADENIGLLFAGLSPAEDVFGALRPELALVIDRQRFEGAPAVPGVRLPAFCLVARLHAAPDFPGALGVAFQSLMSFVNADRTREGEAPFLLDVLTHEGVTIRTARLVTRAGESAEAAGTAANWSPAMAVLDDWLLVGSACEQVERLITALRAEQVGARAGLLGFDLDVPAAVRALRDNREALIANSMLEEGHDPETAARDIDRLLRFAGLLRRVAGSLQRAEDALLLELTLQFADRAP